MKFDKLTTLLEAFSNWQYSLPTDKEELLFDFYIIAMMPEPNDMNLLHAHKDALTKILTESKKQLLDAVFFAVCAEFRHIFDDNDADPIKKFFDKYKMKDFVKEYAVNYGLLSGSKAEFLDRDREELRSKFTEDNRGYQNSYKATMRALKKTETSIHRFMTVAAEAFLGLNWPFSYGGKSWAAICDGWLKLYEANTENSMIVWIDHVYDLQHNTDTVFNKIKEYYKDNVGYKWIKKALDKKAHITNLFELYLNMSSDLRRFFLAVMKDTSGMTLEMWQKDAKKTSVTLNKKGIKKGINVDGSVLASSQSVSELDLKLIEASKNGYNELIKNLLKRGANVNVNNGIPLIWAIKKGHMDVVKILIANGVDINISNSHPLRTALNHGYLNIAKVLIENGADTNHLSYEQLKVVNKLKRSDLKDTPKSAVNTLNGALIDAAGDGRLNSVKAYLTAGADVHADNDLALAMAAENNHLEVVKVLLDAGADVYAQDGHALEWAVSGGNFSVVKTLLDYAISGDKKYDIYPILKVNISRAEEKGFKKIAAILKQAAVEILNDPPF